MPATVAESRENPNLIISFSPQLQFDAASFLQPLFHHFGSVFDRQLKVIIHENLPELLQRKQIDSKAEQCLLPSIVVFREKLVKYLTFLNLLCMIGFLADSLHFLQISFLVHVRDERVGLIDMHISLTRVIRALVTILRALMFQTASGNRAGLITKSAAAAMPGDIHRTQLAVQPAEGEILIASNESFHISLSFLLTNHDSAQAQKSLFIILYIDEEF